MGDDLESRFRPHDTGARNTTQNVVTTSACSNHQRDEVRCGVLFKRVSTRNTFFVNPVEGNK